MLFKFPLTLDGYISIYAANGGQLACLCFAYHSGDPLIWDVQYVAAVLGRAHQRFLIFINAVTFIFFVVDKTAKLLSWCDIRGSSAQQDFPLVIEAINLTYYQGVCFFNLSYVTLVLLV